MNSANRLFIGRGCMRPVKMELLIWLSDTKHPSENCAPWGRIDQNICLLSAPETLLQAYRRVVRERAPRAHGPRRQLPQGTGDSRVACRGILHLSGEIDSVCLRNDIYCTTYPTSSGNPMTNSGLSNPRLQERRGRPLRQEHHRGVIAAKWSHLPAQSIALLSEWPKISK